MNFSEHASSITGTNNGVLLNMPVRKTSNVTADPIQADLKKFKASLLTDGEIELMKAGDNDAWVKFDRLYRQKFEAIARPILNNQQDAEDAAQDAFFNIRRGLSGFRADSSFDAWTSTIARNAALELARNKRANVSIDEPSTNEDGVPSIINVLRSNDPNPLQAAIKSNLKDHVIKAIGSLDEDTRNAMLYRYVIGLSLEETARVVKANVNTVKTRVSRGLVAVKKKLAAEHVLIRRGDAQASAHEGAPRNSLPSMNESSLPEMKRPYHFSEDGRRTKSQQMMLWHLKKRLNGPASSAHL